MYLSMENEYAWCTLILYIRPNIIGTSSSIMISNLKWLVFKNYAKSVEQTKLPKFAARRNYARWAAAKGTFNKNRSQVKKRKNMSNHQQKMLMNSWEVQILIVLPRRINWFTFKAILVTRWSAALASSVARAFLLTKTVWGMSCTRRTMKSTFLGRR